METSSGIVSCLGHGTELSVAAGCVVIVYVVGEDEVAIRFAVGYGCPTSTWLPRDDEPRSRLEPVVPTRKIQVRLGTISVPDLPSVGERLPRSEYDVGGLVLGAIDVVLVSRCRVWKSEQERYWFRSDDIICESGGAM